MEKIFESEYRFLCLLWSVEPIGSTPLVRLCDERLGWKKSTTYTVIRKLAAKGIVQNEDAVVTTLVTKEQVDRAESDELLRRTSRGDIPEFFAAFMRGRKLSREEAERIRRMIDEAEER